MILSYLPAGSNGGGLAPVAPYENFEIEAVTFEGRTIHQIIYVDFSNNTNTEITFPNKTVNGEQLYLKYDALVDARSNMGLATRLNIRNSITSPNTSTNTIMKFPNQIKTLAFSEYPFNYFDTYLNSSRFGTYKTLNLLFEFAEEIVVPTGTIINANNFVFYFNINISNKLNSMFENLVTISNSLRGNNVSAGFLQEAASKNYEQTTIYFNNLQTITGNSAFSGASYFNIVLMYEGEVISVPSTTAINVGDGTYFYVPDSLLNDYKNATYWSNKASIIKPISELIV